MGDILLSVVLPTKDRYLYLKSFVTMVESFHQPGLELVVQDNSADNGEFLPWLEDHRFEGLVYDYVPEHLSIIENSDLAVSHSHGRYLCFMGDDDLISRYLYGFAEQMDRVGCDAAVFQKAQYDWPGVKRRAHHFPSLMCPSFQGRLETVDPAEALDKLLQRGATDLGHVPQLYHGIVRRDCLERIRQRTGTYFPGPSPDMAMAVAVCLTARRCLYCDVPFTVAGTAPKSGGGMGANHQHKGSIQKATWLPEGTEAHWEARNPKVWTAPTIWAESALKALRAMGAEDKLERFNYPYSYAYLWLFNPNFQKLAVEQLRHGERFRFAYAVLRLFVVRCRTFVQNFMLAHYGITNKKLRDHVTDSVQAEEWIDRWIDEQQIDLNAMFAAWKESSPAPVEQG